MAFRDFANKAFLFPGTVVSKLVVSIFGSAEKTRDEQDKLVETYTPGLLGLIGAAIGSFITDHKKAIAIAFWSGLAFAGTAVLLVAFWPAALTTITEFAINGYSIVGLVGTDFTAQLLAVAGLAFLADNLIVYTIAAAYDLTNRIITVLPRKSPAADATLEHDSAKGEAYNGSSSRMSALGAGHEGKPSLNPDPAPGHFSSAVRGPKTGAEDESAVEATATATARH